MAVNPSMIGFDAWAAQTSSSIQQSGGGVPQAPADETHWRAYATQLKQAQSPIATEIPDHAGFEKWQDWAARVYDSAQRNGL